MDKVELHIHSEDSQFDSADSVEKMIEQAHSMGITAISFTEHGNMVSMNGAKTKCKELGMKYITGIEAYVRLLEKSPEGRCHLVLYAKDEIGEKALAGAVSDSYTNREKTIPVMNAEILNHYFAKGHFGHDHVIASSACISGVVCNILQINEIMDKKIEKCQKKLKKMGFVPFDNDKYDALCNQIDSITEEINRLKPIAERKFGRLEQSLKKMSGDDLVQMTHQLDVQKSASKKAIEDLLYLKEKKKTLSKDKTAMNKVRKTFLDKQELSAAILEEIQIAKASKDSPRNLYTRAKKAALSYEKLFGKGNFYLEIQNHRMPEEIKYMPLIAQIAKETELPIVATNDAHMAKAGEKSVRARQLMRSFRFIKNKDKKWNMVQPIGVADKELYIKTTDELKEILTEIIDESTVSKAIAGRSELLGKCTPNYKVEKHYPKYPPEMEGETSDACLRRKVKEGCLKRFSNSITKEYLDRINYELDVMCSMGYADYHLIVQDYMEYARLLGKLDLEYLPEDFELHKFDKAWLTEKGKNRIGLGVGPGRGSASGSLVCYVLGITDIDPIKYGLLFERFLNPSRVSMPDIDCDIATSIREIVYEYVADKYGADNVCHIMTKGCQKARKVIDNCSKLLGDQLYGDTTYFSTIASAIKNLIVDDVLPTRNAIIENFPENENALKIYDDACLVNGTFVNYGAHAAGVVISDGKPVKEYIPLMYDSKTGSMKTQCDMIQVEECHGLLKMDFLGLNTLDIITKTTRMIEKNHGKKIDVANLPFESEVFNEIYATGFTNGVFQVESSGMKQMLKQANPKNIEDMIIWISMYRPGPMDYIPKMLPVVAGDKQAEYLTPKLKPILGMTYGAIVYQEQVMKIFRDLAGYSLGDSDTVRRYMSKKKMSKLVKEEKAFIYGDSDRNIAGCVSNGIAEKVAKTLFDQMTDFAKYAFNKSHAASYAVVSYMTAWLKYHYPKEFLAVCLSSVKVEKRKLYIDDCKHLNIKVCAPDINLSDADFSIKDGNICYGLKHILNVAKKSFDIISERKNHGKFNSLTDFVYRTGITGNILDNLIDCGCFDSIMSISRNAMKEAATEFPDISKIIKDKKKKLLSESLSEKQISNTKKALENAKLMLESAIYDKNLTDDLLSSLLREKELMGIMMSGHPTNDYGSEKQNGCIKISEATPINSALLMGMIQELRIVNRKSDNAKMAFFKLDMPDGDINVCCFTKEYRKFKKMIQENAVIKIQGNISEVEDDYNDEKELQIVLKDCCKLNPNQKAIFVFGNETDESGWKTFRKNLSTYETTNGYPLLLFNANSQKFQKTNLFVTEEILKSNKLQASWL